MNSDKNRTHTRIAVFLVGMRDQHILLGKRINTQHMNGCWSLCAGHVYEDESIVQAMIREAYEECNLILTPEDLQLVGAMHHRSPPFDYINFVFKADLTNHELYNNEPHKCQTLAFYPLHELPMPVEPYIRDIIERTVQGGSWVMEYGWDDVNAVK